MASRRVISTPDDVTRLMTFMGDMPMPYTVSIAQGKGRTMSQNGLVHMWFGEVAKQGEGQDIGDVKAECNLTYGMPILQRDDEAYRRFVDRLSLNREQTLYSLKRGFIPCTRLMTTKQLTEYMDGMGRDYRQQGYTLTDPEILKYQDVAA